MANLRDPPLDLTITSMCSSLDCPLREDGDFEGGSEKQAYPTTTLLALPLFASLIALTLRARDVRKVVSCGSKITNGLLII